jgi:outer membrane autotransporter protein
MLERIGGIIGWFSAVTLLASSAAAQQPPPGPPPPAVAEDSGDRTHDGFFFRIGLNVGPLMLNSKLEGGGRTLSEADYSGLTFGTDLMFGGTPIDGLVIGGALILTSTSDPSVEVGGREGTADGTMLLAGIAAFANYYIDPKAGLHIQALLGFAAVDFVAPSGASGGKDPSGVMLGLGVGYDFFFADEWSVGPFARLLYAPTSVEEGGVSHDATYIYPSIGAAITLH